MLNHPALGSRADAAAMSSSSSSLSVSIVHLTRRSGVADLLGWALHFVKSAGNTKITDTAVFVTTFISIMPLGEFCADPATVRDRCVVDQDGVVID